MGVIIIRTAVLYLYIMLIMRIAGKRQVGELQPFELVVAILIADLAAIPMESVDIPLIHGLLPLTVLLIMELCISYLSLRHQGFRRLVSGTPSILIENGRIIEQQLREQRYNLNDLLEQMRLAGYPNIQDIEFAILETGGQLSVIPKSQKRPVSPEDLGLSTSYEGLPYTLIVDGKVNADSLTRIGLSQEWLMKELQSQGFDDADQVLFASINTDGSVYVQGKDSKRQPA